MPSDGRLTRESTTWEYQGSIDNIGTGKRSEEQVSSWWSSPKANTIVGRSFEANIEKEATNVLAMLMPFEC